MRRLDRRDLLDRLQMRHVDSEASEFVDLQAGEPVGPPAFTVGPPDASTLVSVVMTTHDSADYVRNAAVSILDQTHQRLELIVVDDASSDTTLEVLRSLESMDDRVHVVPMARNRGTYWAKNLGLLHAKGAFATFQDSDDTSDPRRIERQLEALRGSPGAFLCTTQFVRVAPDGSWVVNRGRYERLGYNTLLFHRRTVLERTGFLDTVRVAADDEFYRRLQELFPASCRVHITEPLYLASVRSGSLTDRNEVTLELPSMTDDPLGHLSPERRDYVLAYREWHQRDPDLVMPFPPRRRPFVAPDELCDPIEGIHVTAHLSWRSGSEELLRQGVRSLLHQVDRVAVYVDGEMGAPLPAFLDHARVDVLVDGGASPPPTVSPHPVGAYHLLATDDLAYPPNVVAYLVAKSQQYADRCVVGLEGTVGAARYRADRRLARDVPVDRLAPAGVLYRDGLIEFRPRADLAPAASEEPLARAASDRGVPLVAVARGRRFVRPVPSSGRSGTGTAPDAPRGVVTGQPGPASRVAATIPPASVRPSLPVLDELWSPGRGSRDVPTFVKIYGVQRSGTNWLEYVLEENFQDVVVVDLPLGSKHEAPRPHEALEEFHDPAADLPVSWSGLPYRLADLRRALHAGEVRAAAVVKPLVPWLLSFHRLRHLKEPDRYPSLTAELVGEWTRRWVELNRSYVERLDAVGWRHLVVNYVDLLTDLDATVGEVASVFELGEPPERIRSTDRSTLRSTDEMHGDDVVSAEPFDPRYCVDRRYLEELAPEHLDAVRTTLAGLELPPGLLPHVGILELDGPVGAGVMVGAGSDRGDPASGA